MMNNSLTKESYNKFFKDDSINLLNPLSKDMAIMRNH